MFLRVCRSWSQISLETPELWSSIHVSSPKVIRCSIARSEERERGLLDAASQWLARSGTRPLQISIYGCVHDMLIPIIFPHRHRLQRLHIISILSSDLYPLRDSLGDGGEFEILEEVSLTVPLRSYGGHPEIVGTPLWHAPRVSCVKIAARHPLAVLPVLPWSQIRAFSCTSGGLTHATLDQLLDVLPNLTSLEDLSLAINCDSRSTTIPAPLPAAVPKVVLPRLRHLSVDIAPDSNMTSTARTVEFLDILATPHLSDVTLETREYMHGPTRALRDLLARSGNTLRRLVLTGKLAVHELIQLLYLSPELQHLEIKEEKIIFLQNDNLALARTLCGEAEEEGEGMPLPGDEGGTGVPAVLLCPGLRTLILDGCTSFDGDWLVRFLNVRLGDGARLARESGGTGLPALSSVHVRFLQVQHGIEDRVAPFNSQGVTVDISFGAADCEVEEGDGDDYHDGDSYFGTGNMYGAMNLPSGGEGLESGDENISLGTSEDMASRRRARKSRRRIGKILVKAMKWLRASERVRTLKRWTRK